MAETVQKGDIGTVFEIELTDNNGVLDISSATVKEIIFTKPNGTTLTKSAVFTTDGTDGKIRYLTLVDDLQVLGEWKIQGHIVMAGGEWHSVVGKFSVLINLT